MAQRSHLLFKGASNDDDAAKLTTSYSYPPGLSTASTAQLDVVATLSSADDEVIIQSQRNGVTKNTTYGWSDFEETRYQSFTPGTYRLVAYFRGNGITGIRIGLSSTATVDYACVTAVS
ncbi:hypothetical protein OAK65_02655 [Synechococcus sp. AH-551-N17]|nr:hypothetical protein [Synechococcus sp. AH-551-N17]